MSQALPEGMIFAGRYRVVRCIASGAMGAVYEVVHLGTERRRALKVMHPHMFQSDEMRARFAQEARVTSRIESEYIVDVSDAGVDEATRTPYLVMELLQGEELGERLKRLGRLPPVEVVTFLSQAAMALDRTHKAAIVHRDLKPGNLFLTERDDGSPRIKILDFGVAKVIAEGSTGGGATQSLGTPLYMPPEQFRAGTKLTPAADIFSLGMLAYALLVGEPYWAPEAKDCNDVIAFALVVLRGPQEPPVARAAARGVVLPPAFNAWFGRMTAMDPTARFARATEGIKALGEVLGVATGLGAGPASSGLWSASSLTSDSGSRPLVAATTSNVERMGGSTSAAVTLGQKETGTGVFVAVAAVTALSIGGLGLGAYTWMQARSEKPAKGVEAVAPSAPVLATALPVLATAPPAESTTAPAASAARGAGTAAASAGPVVTVAPSVSASASAPAGGKVGALPPATVVRKPAGPASTSTVPAKGLLGRD